MCLLYLLKSIKLNFVTCLLFLIISGHYVPVIANRLILRPMSASEVYRVLRESGRENVVPEGRVVNQGLSALTGFTLGLAKGIGGSLLVSLAMAGLNSTSFGSWFGTTNNTSATVQTQEICFSTRSANEINDSVDRSIGKIRQVEISKIEKKGGQYKTNPEAIKLENARATETVATSPSTPAATPPSTPVGTSPTTNTPPPGATPTSTPITTPTTTNTNIPTTTGGTVPSTENNGTGTNTETTTDTGDESAINCIVVQKQQRKRRSAR